MTGQRRVFHALADFISPRGLAVSRRDGFVDVNGHDQKFALPRTSGKRFPEFEMPVSHHHSTAHLVAQMPGKFAELPPQFGLHAPPVSRPGFERIKQSTHAVIRAVRRAGRLACGARCGNRRRVRCFSRCGMRGERGLHSHTGFRFSPRPRAHCLDGQARTLIFAFALVKRENTLGTVRTPAR